jgi:hypothetical protein
LGKQTIFLCDVAKRVFYFVCRWLCAQLNSFRVHVTFDWSRILLRGFGVPVVIDADEVVVPNAVGVSMGVGLGVDADMDAIVVVVGSVHAALPAVVVVAVYPADPAFADAVEIAVAVCRGSCTNGS